MDQIWVEILSEGQQSVVWTKADLNETMYAWYPIEISLDAWVNKSIQLRFAFDSMDEKDNDQEGVYIDDVSVLMPCQ